MLDRRWIIYHPRQDWSLAELHGVFSEEFLNALCEASDDFSDASLSMARQRVSGLKEFHDFLLRERESDRKCLLHLVDGVFGTVLDWTLASLAFRHYIKSRSLANSTKNKFVAGLNYWLGRLQHDGRVARFPLPSIFLAEKKVSNSLIEFKLPEHLEELGASADDSQEINTVLAHIRHELDAMEPENLEEAAMAVLLYRLKSVRNEAERQFLAARKKRHNGLRAIRRGRKDLESISSWLASQSRKGVRADCYDEIAALTNSDFQDAIFSWCWYKNGGLEPKSQPGSEVAYRRIRKEVNKRGIDLTDTDFADAFCCGEKLWSSAMMLLIHDLFGNVDSIRKISFDADKLDGFGLVNIEWEKVRSKAILGFLDDRNSAVSPSLVVRSIRAATRKYRPEALDVDQQNLFLHHHTSKTNAKDRKVSRQRPVTPSDGNVTIKLKKIIHSASGGEWYGTGKSIRVSRLLYEGLSGGLIAVQQSAQHKSIRTSKLYSDNTVVQLKHDRTMREFRDWLQALITINLEDVPTKLNIDPDSYEDLKESILGSRFGGVFCSDSKSGVQPGTIKGVTCHRVSRCLVCEKRRSIFVATESNIVEVLQWNEALSRAYESKIVDVNKDRQWLFWAIYIDTILTKLRRGGARFSSALLAAESIAATKKNRYLDIDFGVIL